MVKKIFVLAVFLGWAVCLPGRLWPEPERVVGQVAEPLVGASENSGSPARSNQGLPPDERVVGQVSLSLETVGALAFTSVPLVPSQGLGLEASAFYRVSDFFAAGFTSGLVEFIAPRGQQDTKTAWLDISEKFFPLRKTSWGEPYAQLGFGFSPYIGGVFEDYWPFYAGQNFGKQTPSDTVYWNAQAALGYLFTVQKDLSLDLGVQADLFWPPGDLLLRTLGLRTGLVWSFDWIKAE